MSLSCDVVMDLVALYQDGLASPNTQKEVAAHLCRCKKCRTQYRQYRKEYQAISKKNRVWLQPDMEQSFYQLAKKMRYRRMFLFAGASVSMVISWGLCIWVLYRKRKR